MKAKRFKRQKKVTTEQEKKEMIGIPKFLRSISNRKKLKFINLKVSDDKK